MASTSNARLVISSLVLTFLSPFFSHGQNYSAGETEQSSCSDEAEKIAAYSILFDKPSDKAFAAALRASCRDCRVVGLGEVSHYTRECYQLKRAAINAMADAGFDCLVLEVDFGQALIWDQFVTTGEGDLEKIVGESGWFTYRTAEFKKVLSEIKEHNQSSDKSFRIFGMEMTAINHTTDWLAAWFRAAGCTEKQLEFLHRERKEIAFQQHSPGEVKDAWDLYFRSKKLLAEVKPQRENHLDYSTAERAIEILRQFATYVSQDDFGLKAEFRDQFSFRNVLWALRECGTDSRAVVWAHNGHIAKSRTPMSQYDALGHYLREQFGEGYFSVGMTFNEGEFGAFSREGFRRFRFDSLESPSLTKDLRELGSPFVWLHLRKPMDSPARPKALFSPRPIRADISENYNSDWSQEMTLNVGRTYDGLLYIDKSTFPTTLPWRR